jgi:hypothetical protein
MQMQTTLFKVLEVFFGGNNKGQSWCLSQLNAHCVCFQMINVHTGGGERVGREGRGYNE